MRIKKMKDGREIITTEDGPRPKPGQPGPEIISTANIEQIKAKRKVEAEAAEKAAAEKLSAGKEAVKSEK
jgi:hypothetical protein